MLRVISEPRLPFAKNISSYLDKGRGMYCDKGLFELPYSQLEDYHISPVYLLLHG